MYFTATAEKTNLLEFPKDVPQPIGNGESILIVDDVAEQREITTKILQELGYSVDAVKSGESAVAFLKKGPVDLLMLDMYMEPGMDGLDTYRRVLKLHPNQKAIIASGYAETSRVREALKLGAGSFIRKPFFMDTISKVIRAELDKRVG
ncbi:MAG: response regulator [Deltaproteobacteria bacterium]|nr:response regulator [Deltaproteobacteria bacterium]